MKKYLLTVGFCIGLLPVILVSIINGALMTDGWLTVPTPLDHSAYSLIWLFSYILTASTIGAFVIRKGIRKFVFIPLSVLLFTVLSFWAFYRLHHFLWNAVFLGLAIAAEGTTLVFLMKNTRYAFAGAMINILWYCYLFGINLIVWIAS